MDGPSATWRWETDRVLGEWHHACAGGRVASPGTDRSRGAGASEAGHAAKKPLDFEHPHREIRRISCE
jgi:hypothetical protein